MPRGRPRKNPDQAAVTAPVEKKSKREPRTKKGEDGFSSEQSMKAASEVRATAKAKYKNAAEVRAICDAYFDQCDREGKLYGEAGLALALGVSLCCLNQWYTGTRCPYLQEDIQRAYLRIQEQIESSPVYFDKALASRAIFLLKQPKLGGKQDKIETSSEVRANITFGKGVKASDFE